jgi:hypothetical protein
MFDEIIIEVAEGLERDADDVTPKVLLASFERLVSEAMAEAGHDQIVEEAGVESAAVEAAASGDVAALRLEDAAAIATVSTDRDADAVVAELRDHLLMGMATAVLDVDTIAAAIDTDLTGQEVQQTLEGRAAMTLDQLAEIAAVIEQRKP